MKTRILATLGPASLRGDVLRALDDRIDGLRIELSLRSPEEVNMMIDIARRHAPSLPIYLETRVFGPEETSREGRSPALKPAPTHIDLTGSTLERIETAVRRGVRRVALSSLQDANDVRALRAVLPDDAMVLSVIDSEHAWHNRLEVMDSSDAVILDRGRLLGIAPDEYLPYRQRAFLRDAYHCGRAAYLANGPGQPMVAGPTPTIAQTTDVIHSLFCGARGFVLTTETATGPDPIGSVDGLIRCIRAFEHLGKALHLGEIAILRPAEPSHDDPMTRTSSGAHASGCPQGQGASWAVT